MSLTDNSTNVWEVRVHARAIKGRDRTLKSHVLKLGTLPDNGNVPTTGVPTDSEVQAACNAAFKLWSEATLVLQPVRIKKYDNQIVSTSFDPFDPRTIKTKVVRV